MAMLYTSVSLDEIMPIVLTQHKVSFVHVCHKESVYTRVHVVHNVLGSYTNCSLRCYYTIYRISKLCGTKVVQFDYRGHYVI